jgi:flagellar basal-body rod protein FlgG
MMRGMYSAISGLRNHQIMLDVTANDLANVNTVGFKASRTAFDDLLYSELNPRDATAQGNKMGLGTEVSAIQVQMDSGQAQTTGRGLDLRIDGTGFLPVKQADGTIAYTRAGNLELDALGQLVTPTGDIVQPRITVPKGATDVTYDPTGAVTATVNGKITKVGQLQLATFTNPAGLDQIGGNKFVATANSGPAALVAPGTSGSGSVVAGQLEMANVNAVDEMVGMITTQRAYEGVSKVVQASDEMLNTANQLRR